MLSYFKINVFHANVNKILILYWLTIFLLSHWPTIEIKTQFQIVQIDKILHAVVYAILTFLLIYSGLFTLKSSSHLSSLLAVLVAAVYAMIDELTQPFVGRTLDTGDIAANFMGILSVFLILNSHQPSHSMTVVINLIRSLLILITPTLILVAILPEADIMLQKVYRQFDVGVNFDKTTHFISTMSLTCLLALSYPMGKHRPKLSTGIVLITMLCSAPIVEWTQQLTHRGIYDQSDIWAHELGLLAGITVWAVALTVKPLLKLLIQRITGDVPEDRYDQSANG